MRDSGTERDTPSKKTFYCVSKKPFRETHRRDSKKTFLTIHVLHFLRNTYVLRDSKKTFCGNSRDSKKTFIWSVGGCRSGWDVWAGGLGWFGIADEESTTPNKKSISKR